MDYTTNYNLNLPSGDDSADIDKLNENAEIIDETLAQKADKTELSNKQDKFSTKSSSENFNVLTLDTTTIISGDLRVNAVTPSDHDGRVATKKYVDDSAPTKTSDLTNDSGFITKAVDNLVNYYTKSQTDTALAQKQDKKQFELIEAITLDEDTQTIERQQDTQGNAYAFDDFMVVISYSVALPTNSSWRVTLHFSGIANLISGRSSPVDTREISYFIDGGSTSASGARAVSYSSQKDGIMTFYISKNITNFGYVSSNAIPQVAQIVQTNGKKIDKITVDRISSSFPGGTKIHIYGVR